MKQTTFGMAVLLLGLANPSLAAKDTDQEAGQRDQRSITTESGTEIIIRSEADRRRREDDNSNWQSNPDATRGLERAGERRAEQADSQARAGQSLRDEQPWYDPFGWLPSDDGDEPAEADDSWWWPFD